MRGSTTGWAPMIALLAALAAGLLLAVGSASADPSIQSKRAQAEAIMAEMDQLDVEIAQSAEAWNLAKIELDGIDADPTASRSAAASTTRRTIIGVHPAVEPPSRTPPRLRTDPPVAVWPVTSRGA